MSKVLTVANKVGYGLGGCSQHIVVWYDIHVLAGLLHQCTGNFSCSGRYTVSGCQNLGCRQ